jgi:hypothetical protein
MMKYTKHNATLNKDNISKTNRNIKQRGNNREQNVKSNNDRIEPL